MGRKFITEDSTLFRELCLDFCSKNEKSIEWLCCNVLQISRARLYAIFAIGASKKKQDELIEKITEFRF